MAPEDTKNKKRKGATDASPKPKKLKKSDDSAAAKKTAKALKSSVAPVDDVKINAKVSRSKEKVVIGEQPEKEKSKKSKKNRKSTDANGNGDSVVEAEPIVEEVKEVTSKKSKKAKDISDEPLEAPVKKSKKSKDVVEEEAAEPAEAKNSKKTSSKQKAPEPETDDDASEGEDGDHIDQTAALLAGFESSEDEEDPAEDHDFDDTNLKPVIPSALRGELSKASHHSDEPGVVFVGRIPHGFYEHQMKSYFSQFGTITRLRLARNKKTGAPKHFAFIEFASSEVADIVAQTMDKYLLFGHILQCKVVPTAQIHPSLFKGANRRFKAVPRAKIAGAELKRGAERAVWEKRIAKEEKRRQFQNKKLKDAMDYEYTGPGLKSVDSVPKKALAVEAEAEPQLLTETAHQDETPKPAEIESAPAAIEKTKAKKSKKSAKAAKEETKVEVPAIEDVVEPVKEMKAKKEKKSKAAVAADKQTPKEEEPVAIAEETPKEASKAKKAKKSKALEATDEATPEKKRKAKSDEQDGAAKVKKAKKGKVSKA